MSLSLDNIVRVSDSIVATGVLRRELGIGLFVTVDNHLGLGADRVAIYSDFASLAKKFPIDSEPYKAGQAWFSQSPFPRNLVVGRWFNEAAGAQLTGGKVTKTAVELEALKATGKLSITINATPYTDTVVDFTDITSYADAATKIQTALTTAGAAVTVTYNPLTGGFVITTTQTGNDKSISYAVAPSEGEDLSQILFLRDNLALSKQDGITAETIVEALNAIQTYNDGWYFIMLDHSVDNNETLHALADYVETNRYMFSAQTISPQVLTPGETESTAYQLYQKQLQRTWMTYSGAQDYKDVSIAGRFSSINFNASNSMITAKFKQLPSLQSDVISLTQLKELERKRTNYYTKFATRAVYSEGTTFSNDAFIDVRYALDWFVNAIQVDIFNLLYASGRIPQTHQGEAVIVDVINRVCVQAVANGMIAGNQVSEAMKNDIILTTGNQDFDGFLASGYLIWSQPIADQPLSERNARKSTAKKVWLKSSGAIHSVEVILNLEN